MDITYTQRRRRRSKQHKQVSFSGQVNCLCKRKCAQNIDIVRQKEIFDKFYALKTWSERVKFIRSVVDRKKCDSEKIIPLIKLKERNFIHSCILRDGRGTKHQVCISFLTKLLQVNRVKIFRAVSSIDSNPSALDGRGKFPARKAKLQDKRFMQDFIESLPKYEHHYNTSQSSKKYLHPDLNIVKLHKLYQAKCVSEEKKAMSLSYFSKFFKSIGFEFPKLRTDTCWKCNDFNTQLKRSIISIDRRATLNNKKQEHLSLAEKVVNKYVIDVQEAQKSFDNTEILTFALGTPTDMPSIASTDYTKRRLWIHEFCVFDEVRQLAYVYIWPESVASKGSQEIGSCILEHLRSNLSLETKQLILYCDPLFGQNCNIKISLILQKFLDSWPHSQLSSIQQRFFVTGHGFNSCDRCFGMIKKKKLNIYIPSNLVGGINEPKVRRKIYAFEMRTEHFFSTKPLEDLLASKTCAVDGRKINWSIHESITYNRDKSFVLSVERFNRKPIDIVLKKRNEADKLSDIALPLLYPTGRYISQLKYNDLKEFLNIIPNEYHFFYESLKYVDTKDEKDYAFCIQESSDEEKTKQ